MHRVMDGTRAASHLIGALSSSLPAREDRHLDDHADNFVGAGISVCTEGLLQYYIACKDWKVNRKVLDWKMMTMMMMMMTMMMMTMMVVMMMMMMTMSEDQDSSIYLEFECCPWYWSVKDEYVFKIEIVM